MNPDALGGQAPDDGVVLSRIIACKRCGAEDRYALTTMAQLHLTAEIVWQARRGAKPEEGRIIKGAARLWDGTDMRRPTESIAHLRALAEREPESGEAWRRLGNLCEGYDRMPDAEAAWRGAVRDPGEMEAAFSLARWLGQIGKPEEAIGFALQAVERLPGAKVAPDARRAIAAELCDLLGAVASRLSPPLAMMAVWPGGRGGEAVIHASAIDLRKIRRWDRLGELLGEDVFRDVRFTQELPEDGMHSQLADLLDAGPAHAPAAPHVRRAPRVGRNEPCPCGSGRKHKRCCGR